MELQDPLFAHLLLDPGHCRHPLPSACKEGDDKSLMTKSGERVESLKQASLCMTLGARCPLGGQDLGCHQDLHLGLLWRGSNEEVARNPETTPSMTS